LHCTLSFLKKIFMPEKQQQDETENKLPAAPTGNASNPSGSDEAIVPEGENQLLGAKAERYLREVASIEDMPDDNDWQEADKVLRNENETNTDKP
jgi:hypothetical protein